MLEDKDIDKLTSVLASKKDVEIVKENLDHLTTLVQGIIISNDSIAKSIGDLTLEYAAVKMQLSRHDKWIREIAEKMGLRLSIE